MCEGGDFLHVVVLPWVRIERLHAGPGAFRWDGMRSAASASQRLGHAGLEVSVGQVLQAAWTGG